MTVVARAVLSRGGLVSGVEDGVRLRAPGGYWRLIPADKERFCNGAGTRGIGWLVPDTFYGLRITAAANIHDYCYCVGRTEGDRTFADELFLENLRRIIQARTASSVVRALRLARARTYYWAVRWFGRPAFARATT